MTKLIRVSNPSRGKKFVPCEADSDYVGFLSNGKLIKF